MNMEDAVLDALRKGWITQSYSPRMAVFTYPGSNGMSVGGHVFCGILTLFTLVFGIVWLGLYAYYTMTAIPTQTLIIRDTGTEITREVVKS
jgi:hypothetical protein